MVVFRADVVINDSKFVNKSFFPPLWDDKKVVGKILESLTTLHKNPKKQANGCFVVNGLTQEGLKIRTHITPSGNIISSYPIIP